LTALPPRTPPIQGDGRLGSGIDVVDTAIRGGGYYMVLVGPCQKNQKTYQRAQVGEGCRGSNSLHLRGSLRRLEAMAIVSGPSAV